MKTQCNIYYRETKEMETSGALSDESDSEIPLPSDVNVGHMKHQSALVPSMSLKRMHKKRISAFRKLRINTLMTVPCLFVCLLVNIYMYIYYNCALLVFREL